MSWKGSNQLGKSVLRREHQAQTLLEKQVVYHVTCWDLSVIKRSIQGLVALHSSSLSGCRGSFILVGEPATLWVVNIFFFKPHVHGTQVIPPITLFIEYGPYDAILCAKFLLFRRRGTSWGGSISIGDSMDIPLSVRLMYLQLHM